MLKAYSVVLALFFAGSSLAGELRVPLPDREALILDVPQGWKEQVNRPRQDIPPTIVLSSVEPRAFQVLITPIWPINGQGSPTGAEIESMVKRAAESAQSQAVEAKLEVVKLAASGRVGYYFSATDRAPEHDGYKFLTQGAVGLNELRVMFTVLNNESGKHAGPGALELLRAMRRAK